MIRQRNRSNAPRNADRCATVSTRALIILSPVSGRSAHDGTRPQHNMSPRGLPSLSVVTASTSSPGATLYLGLNSIDSPIGNRTRTAAGSAVASEYRPHTAASAGARRSLLGSVRLRPLLAPPSDEREHPEDNQDENEAVEDADVEARTAERQCDEV